MPVFFNDSIKILYIHIPKTGGTSVTLFFERNGFQTAYLDGDILPTGLNTVRRCSPQHMHAETLNAVFNLGKFDYRFATVRNPLSRIVSEYKMRFAGREDPTPLDAWLREILARYQHNAYIHDNHIRPQTEFLVPDCEVFKLEDGYTDRWVETLAARTGIDFAVRKVWHARRAPPHAGGTAPTRDVIERVQAFYAQDYDVLGYERSADAPP
ncbi:MAG: sulfotransferase family 2 domain-containing protein [Alphaproteobacteria bacterium]|nr:sulfotransferase family 2 domain-containing protein [Alphaproteobacteria bacterium]